VELHAVEGWVGCVQLFGERAEVIKVGDVVCADDDEFLIELVKITAIPSHIFLEVIGFNNEDFVLPPCFAGVWAGRHAA
jgi:hypothetical protein